MTTLPQEPRVNCAQCRVSLPIGDAMYDEYAEHFYCDDDCFGEWIDDNFDVVKASYKRSNIYEDYV